MKIKMVNNKIGVVETLEKKEYSGFSLATPESPFNFGIVKYASEGSKYPEGTKVFFGTKREQIRMGEDIVQVMEEDNIVAIAAD